MKSTNKLTPQELRKIAEDFASIGIGSTFTPPQDDDEIVDRIFRMFGKGKNGKGGKYESNT